jgi:Tol biopolymer transport system component
VIVFAPRPDGPISKVSETGGPAVVITKFPESVATHRNPVFMRDGKHFLYVQSVAQAAGDSIRVGSIDGKENRKVLDYGTTMGLVGDWLLTVRDGNLLAQRFDQSSFTVTGKPAAIAQHLEWYGPKFNAAFAAGGGTLVYQHAAQPRKQFLYADSDAAAPAPTGEVGEYQDVSLSPDGKRFIVNRFDRAEASSDLWVFDVGASGGERLTHAKNTAMDLNFGVFSPDGQNVAVSISENNGNAQCWIQPVGGGSHEPIAARGQYALVTDWRSDDTLLVSSQGQLTTVKRGSPNVTPIMKTEVAQGNAVFSPDGKFVAFDGIDGGRREVYVTSYPAATAKWQISTAGGSRPQWSPDGKKLYFVGDEQVMSAAVRMYGNIFAAGPSQAVRAFGDHIATFSLSRSGRFLILRTVDAGKAPLSVVLNWRRMVEK